MNTIIVPIDFSKQSEFALKAAAYLANKHKAAIITVHMLELSEAVFSSTDSQQAQQAVFFLKAAEKKLSGFLDKDYLEGISVTAIVKPYKVFVELNKIAEEYASDLVVMGSNGSDGLEALFIGSNAEKVVRSAEIPVLVVKKDFEEFLIERFVFACDFKDESLSAFQKALAFAELFSVTPHLVYINTPGDTFGSTAELQNRIQHFLQKACTQGEVVIYNDYSVEKGILNYGKSVGADLIGIPTHGRTGISRFFMGSIGEDVANQAKIPVITFKI